MIIDNTAGLTIDKIVTVQCDRCTHQFRRSIKEISQRRKRMGGQDCCVHCARKQGATKRPQNSNEFCALMRNSEAHRIGILNRKDTSGEANHMWGKKASTETRLKMSKSRTGKLGATATAWKGGKLSFNRRIKSALQKRWKWFSSVIDRDKQCIKCGADKKLDAHHTIPISTLIKQVLIECPHTDPDLEYEYVVNHDSIKDIELLNGVTLCRECHKLQHMNWGSHEASVKT